MIQIIDGKEILINDMFGHGSSIEFIEKKESVRET